MSGTLPANEPECVDAESDEVELVIDARPRDLGGFVVRRTLPSHLRRQVGPFVFFDHMGPARLPAGEGFDVRPHPHIGLATLTYLFEGEIVHRDSLGSMQPIRPGDVNWMVAGRGIAHSERSSPTERAHGVHVHGIQCWTALPIEREETEPFFEHHAAADIPRVTRGGAVLDIVAGRAFGVVAPTSVLSPTLYVHAVLDVGARLALDAEHDERAVYVVEGAIGCDGRIFQPGEMAILRPGKTVTLEATSPTRAMLIGGAKVAGERHIYWNFVSSSNERIERAKDDWRSERFAKVVGDELERIPLPDEPRHASQR